MRKFSIFQQRWRGRSSGPSSDQRGISLMELTAILASLTALAVGLTYKTSDFFTKSGALDSDAMLRMADSQLRQYVALNGRLPCPDLDADGVADDDVLGSCSGKQKGYLPYKTLGLVDKGYGYGEVPILYGVYRDGTISFTSRSQIFFPSYQDKSDQPVQVTNPRNTFDFCASLEALKALSSTNLAGLNVPTGGVSYNAVYALALPGQANRDGLAAGGWGATVNAQYDGLNGSSATQFESPQASITPVYDDRTFFRGATDLHDYFRCEAMNNSVSLLAEAVTIQKETEDFADSNSEDAAKGLILNAVGVALSLWELGQTIAAIAEANETLGISSGLLATVSATCPIPPWVTCALIPVYATAVTSASIGLGLSIGAAVASGIGVGLNITATVLYNDLKSRTESTAASAPAPATTIPASTVANLKNAYVLSKGSAQTAYNAVPVPAPDVPASKTTLDSTLATLNNDIATVTGNDATLGGLLNARFNGSTSTCTSGQTICVASGFTARQIVQLDGSGNVVMNGNNPVMVTIYTKDDLASPYAPGVAPSLDSYFQAIAQSGSNSALASVTSTDPAVLAAQAALAGSTPADPATALGTANTTAGNYSTLLAATSNFDLKNLNYQAAKAAEASALTAYNNAAAAYTASNTPANLAARDNALSTYNTDVALTATALSNRNTARDTLRTAMGSGSWDTALTTSLCGAGGCGWMIGGTAATGTGPTAPPKTGSTAVNAYITADANYQNALGYKKLADAATAAATNAWSDRNGYKTALCATSSPSVNWVGGPTTSSNNPGNWDTSEDLLASSVVGLSCTGSAAALNTSTQTAAANAAEKAKYCPGGSAPDANLCALYSATTPVRSTIQGATSIVNTIIQKGVVQ